MNSLSPTTISSQITTPDITKLAPGLRIGFVRRAGMVRLTISRAVPAVPSAADCDTVERLFAVPKDVSWRNYRLCHRQRVGKQKTKREFNVAEAVWYEVVQ